MLYDGAVVKKNKKAYKSLLVAEDYDGLQKLMEEHDKYNAEVMEVMVLIPVKFIYENLTASRLLNKSNVGG